MTENALLEACRTLFGQDVNLNRDFLYYLQPSGAKLAYRTQIKVNHPDRFNNSPQHIRKRQTERFREIHQAYNLLKDFLDQKHLLKVEPIRQPARHKTRPSDVRPAPAKAKRSTKSPRSHRTPAPAIPLEFGMYAYYQGKVTYQDLIEALVWQRRQRPTMGAIAQKWGWLTNAQVLHILKFRGQSVRFGKKAIDLGYLTQHQVDTLVRHQRNLQQKLGQFFVEKGLISNTEADKLASHLKSHNNNISSRNRGRRAKSQL